MTLFLGGSKDGETMTVPASDHYVRVIVDPESPRRYSRDIVSTTALAHEEEVYMRRKLRGENETFSVFTPTNWDGDMLIRHLIERATRSE